ncbi:NAC domain-containing protein 104 [Musa acuminata AAA Group]|uniref:NAC domain-containing protein 104 n=1 Tax=Musa acuminata AAA Group TaxID=214697 RepID=UPI0031E0FB00
MSDLPPGFRFFPTDEELVVHFLSRKASRLPCQPDIVPFLDLRRFDPWQLNGKALQGGNHCYFFSHATVNKVSPSGYWMPVGAKETVTSGDKDVGTKTSLVFHIGEAPLGVKTSWVMHEYRLLEDGAAVPSSRTNRNSSSSASRARGNKRPDLNLAICRVQEASFFGVEETELSCLDEVFLSLDDLDEISMPY